MTSASIGEHSSGAERLPRLPMAALFLALFAMGTSLSFVFAALPPIGRRLGLSELQLGLVVAPAALVFVVANAVWGSLSERLGRKRVIVVAIAAASAVSAAFALIVRARLEDAISASLAFALLVAARLVLGALAGGLLPATQAYIADATAPALRTRGLALIGAGLGLGMVSGPGLAAVVASLGPVAPFVAVAVIAAIALALVLLALGNTAPSSAAAGRLAKRTPLGRILPLLSMVVLAYSAYGVVLQVTGFRLQDQFGVDAAGAIRLTGLALMVMSAGLVATQLILARIALPAERTTSLLRLGMVAALLAMGLLWSPFGLVVQLAGMTLLGVGLGMILPAALGLLTIAAESAGDQGRVGGLSGAAQGLGMAIGPLAGAAAYGIDRLAPYVVAFALLAVGCALAFAERRR